jgi:hypothetical protein
LVLTWIYPGYYIDVQDTARLLVAGIALTSVANERILAYNGQASWNTLRQDVRGFRPDLVTGDDEDAIGMEISDAHEDSERAEEILRQVGRSGFTGKMDMLRDFVDSVYWLDLSQIEGLKIDIKVLSEKLVEPSSVK